MEVEFVSLFLTAVHSFFVDVLLMCLEAAVILRGPSRVRNPLVIENRSAELIAA